MYVRFNPANSMYEVREDGTIFFSSPVREEAEAYRDARGAK